MIKIVGLSRNETLAFYVASRCSITELLQCLKLFWMKVLSIQVLYSARSNESTCNIA